MFFGELIGLTFFARCILVDGLDKVIHCQGWRYICLDMIVRWRSGTPLVNFKLILLRSLDHYPAWSISKSTRQMLCPNETLYGCFIYLHASTQRVCPKIGSNPSKQSNLIVAPPHPLTLASAGNSIIIKQIPPPPLATKRDVLSWRLLLLFVLPAAGLLLGWSFAAAG